MAGYCVCNKEKHEPNFVLFVWIMGSTNVPEAATGTVTGQAKTKQLCIHQLKIMDQNLLLQPQCPL